MKIEKALTILIEQANSDTGGSARRKHGHTRFKMLRELLLYKR